MHPTPAKKMRLDYGSRGTHVRLRHEMNQTPLPPMIGARHLSQFNSHIKIPNVHALSLTLAHEAIELACLLFSPSHSRRTFLAGGGWRSNKQKLTWIPWRGDPVRICTRWRPGFPKGLFLSFEDGRRERANWFGGQEGLPYRGVGCWYVWPFTHLISGAWAEFCGAT